MAFEEMTEPEREFIRQSMNAILYGPFVDAAEFQTRLGINRSQLRDVLDAWPALDDDDENGDVCLAINNCLNETLHSGCVDLRVWSGWFTAPKADIAAAYQRWQELKGYKAARVR